MQLSKQTEDALCIVSVQEERIDAAVALAFKDAMRVQTDGCKDIVVLDLSEVQFIDSSGLGAIVSAMKNLGVERKMALAGLNPTVERVFQLTRMDTVFSVFTTVDGALAELQH
ncbi:MAG: STAS domain-containing protein [Paracoccaceae bacterium]|nr:STAS domain-containing protein [Paracoccaceae bacterium]